MTPDYGKQSRYFLHSIIKNVLERVFAPLCGGKEVNSLKKKVLGEIAILYFLSIFLYIPHLTKSLITFDERNNFQFCYQILNPG